MENIKGNTEDTSLQDLKLTAATLKYLKTAARWAKFLALMGFVFVGLMILAGLFIGVIYNISESDIMMDQEMSIPSLLLSFFYISLAVIMLIPNLFMNSFANKMVKSIENNDEKLLSKSFRSLKNWFLYFFLSVVVLIILYIIGLIFGLSLTFFS